MAEAAWVALTGCLGVRTVNGMHGSHVRNIIVNSETLLHSVKWGMPSSSPLVPLLRRTLAIRILHHNMRQVCKPYHSGLFCFIPSRAVISMAGEEGGTLIEFGGHRLSILDRDPLRTRGCCTPLDSVTTTWPLVKVATDKPPTIFVDFPPHFIPSGGLQLSRLSRCLYNPLSHSLCHRLPPIANPSWLSGIGGRVWPS
jgi:hypothetical protein